MDERPKSSEPSETRTPLPAQLLHELRGHLHHIIGYSEMMAEEANDSGLVRGSGDVEKIRDAGHRILALIEENFDSTASLPMARVEEEDDASFEPSAEREHGVIAPGVLLVVDDDASNRDVLSRRLQRQGHTVMTAAAGEEALRMMSETAFDVVLLDIMMPDMDGYEVLMRTKENPGLAHIPVIMVSALHDVQSVARCIEAGATDYLTKPFNPTLLSARIGSCLEKKRGRDRELALFEQLQQNYKLLQEVEQFRDDMRNMIVHDLRTPLTAVIIGVEMLAQHGSLNETQREMMGIATGGGKTLLGMINDLLDVEKMESGTTRLNYQQLSAATLVAAAIEQVKALGEISDTELAIQVAANVGPFAGDESKLSRTLVNLIANAIKFTRKGTVTISVMQQDPETVRFAVRDNGMGIPAEAFDRIFEKFGQVDGLSKVGTGLGLAFCKLAVEAHGGNIQVESIDGQGSTFSFTVPVHEKVVAAEG